MSAIWEGDMTKLEDIINFQLILDNTHTWAMREYKPLISTYINQWIHIHCRSGIDSANAALTQQLELTDRCQQVIPMVQSVLENHSSIELDYSKHSMMTPLLLSMLVKEIISSERLTLIQNLETMILIQEEKEKKAQASTQDNQREFVQTQETVFSRVTTFDVDNMDDEDYEEPHSNRKSQTVPTASPNSDERRRCSRLNPQLASPTCSASDGSTRPGSTTRNTHDLEAQRGEVLSQPRATSYGSSAFNASVDKTNEQNHGNSSRRIAIPVSRSRGRSVPNDEVSTPRPFSFSHTAGSVARSFPWGVPNKDWAAQPKDISINFGPLPSFSTDGIEPFKPMQSPPPYPYPKTGESSSHSGNEQREIIVIEDSQDSP